MTRRYKLDNVEYILLTYSDCPVEFDPQGIIVAVVRSGGVYRLGRELHQNGMPHYHCFVWWVGGFSHPDAGQLFMVSGRRCNIKKFTANPGRRWDYVGKYAGHKDGHYLIGDQCERPGGDKDDSERTQTDIWSEIINATNEGEFFEKLAALAPKQLGCNFGSLKLYADWKYRPEVADYESPPGIFEPVYDLTNWSEANLGRVEGRPRGLVLFGATRLGKTVWARSLGKHNYFAGLFNLDDFSESAEYAIFDDMSGGFSFFPSYKQWMGGQFQFTVTDKFKHKRTVRWGKPTIWLCNTDPRLDWYKPGSSPDFGWMEENADFVELTETIFRANRE
ncbi:replication-associated protein [Tubeweb spider associated circular virus 1]|uniref:Replication-associated protein n=1 Tax=Tubeweb spider associated circular virus 1 TaxID=2293308 RepID=A0A346BP66_9VIRU|nr:replication-associated protein [Tubeweb spider associated circular virus 1]AXL65863.1 replication-associated protein [Tubeweb spider associated circular virus 1]